MASLINKFNRKKIITKSDINPAKCNCRNKNTCPFKGKCQQECVVYKVEFSRNQPPITATVKCT